MSTLNLICLLMAIPKYQYSIDVLQEASLMDLQIKLLETYNSQGSIAGEMIHLNRERLKKRKDTIGKGSRGETRKYYMIMGHKMKVYF